MPKPKIGLLLTGGGARAAYQVGALKAIAEFYPRNHGTPFRVITGTSAGAINSSVIACYASCFRLGVKKLEYIWKNFHAHHVYQCSVNELSAHILRNTISRFTSPHLERYPISLLNNRPLYDLLNSYLDLHRIDRNIQTGYLDAVSVTASDYNTGDSVSFFQGHEQLQEWQRAKRSGIRSAINSKHLLASSAIPLVFPSTRIGRDYFGDGSVHQLSPLSPAIHLGADKIFVIGLEQPADVDLTIPLSQHPSGAEIASHLLDTIFTDTLNSDIERLERVNKLLRTTGKAAHAQLGMKPISHFRIHNTHDFTHIADTHFAELPAMIRILLKLIGVDKHSRSSITSYLMFEQNYTRELIRLGYQDVMAREAGVREFLGI